MAYKIIGLVFFILGIFQKYKEVYKSMNTTKRYGEYFDQEGFRAFTFETFYTFSIKIWKIE